MIDWHALLNACSALAGGEAAGSVLSFGLPTGLFLLGLVGGVTHCAGMCGPFVLAQAGRRLAALPLAETTMLTRLQGAALLPYHFGRATTYTALGAAAAGLVGGVAPLTESGLLPAAALGLAAVTFLLLAAGQVWPQLAGRGLAILKQTGGARWQRLLAPLFAHPVGVGGYLLGVALGFLPCGLVYAAVLAAAAGGSIPLAAAGMAAFAAGTVPALFVVGWLGLVAGRRFRAALRLWMVPVLLLNAAVAAGMAVRWLAL
ncbi:urease accessory protein UreH domain-containing protein [Ferrovibrio xuzhouensis]|uniref:Sulfite exporter TauE/SafE family protein n=1 Tax=Ferrovibrio xuzhouensis TaxID=1576914 RepID=A0ABV7VDH4_9PROT